jgi:Subtilisin inhibitor-like
MRRLLPLLVLAVVLVLAGCAAGEDDAPAASGTPEATGSDPAAGGISQADNDLQIEVDLGDGSAPLTWTLNCVGFVEGSHPQAQAACDHLAGLERPFAPLPADVVCSQQYGGPETARVIGRWGGEPVELDLSRVDGCRIAQWDSLVPVVPAPAS